jgi:hypothetical protein
VPVSLNIVRLLEHWLSPSGLRIDSPKRWFHAGACARCVCLPVLWQTFTGILSSVMANKTFRKSLHCDIVSMQLLCVLFCQNKQSLMRSRFDDNHTPLPGRGLLASSTLTTGYQCAEAPVPHSQA